MTFLSKVALALLGVGVGIAGTLIGAGGGFILAPILVLLYPRDSPDVLTAISLTVVFANALSGSVAYARQGRVDFHSGLVFALAGFPGALVGAWLTRFIDRRVFDPLLGAVLILAAGLILWRPVDRGPMRVAATRTLVERDGTVVSYRPRVALGALLSVAIGFLSSLLGIGGGILHVPAMALLLGFPVHIATATSHFVLALLALTGVAVHLASGSLEPGVTRIIPLGVGVLIGAPFGAWLSSRVRGKWILRGLSIALASVGLRLLLEHGIAFGMPAPAVPRPAASRTASAAGDHGFDHAALDSVLHAGVHDGLVDYRHIRDHDLIRLDHYLDRLAAFDPATLERNERMAFEINLYNATMIRAVVARLDRRWQPSDSSFAVFHEPLVRTIRGRVSLDSLEHAIRLRFHEPRIHVALVCGARSCPPLFERAWRGRDLDRTLERKWIAFLGDPARNRIEDSSRTLRLSPIFKWYAEDFAPLGGPAEIMARALGRNVRGWKVEWLDYDWGLNVTTSGR
ncbi:MAG TPA: TSUP family transporter [Candidatus Udaeobacter sp.]|jgi:uncharacterized membrane protein YfcA|nr:TSUP family transporter [Candidatus Udaeobacter sp.]